MPLRSVAAADKQARLIIDKTAIQFPIKRLIL
jgi:hypothetical protein